MLSWLRRKQASNSLLDIFYRKQAEKTESLSRLLNARLDYEATVWGTLKILFDITPDIVPKDRVDMVGNEIATLKEMGVVAPFAAILVREKDWTEDTGADWAYIQEIARDGGMSLFELVSAPSPMVAPTQMDTVRKVCKFFREKGISSNQAAKHITEGFSKK
jgi:hypothetical protein